MITPLVILTIFVLICLYVPLTLYYSCKLYKKTYGKNARKNIGSCVFLLSRYTSLSLIASVSYIIQFFDLSLWIFCWYDTPYRSILVSIASTIHLITLFIITSSLTLRFWLVHFRMKYNMLSENHEWKKIINSKYQNEESTQTKMFSIMHNMENSINSTKWILSHKGNYGNHRWCLRRAIFLFFVLLIIILCAECFHFSDFINLILSIFIYSVFALLWSILLFLYCRSPQFSDNLFIKNELQYILQINMLFILLYIIFIVVFGLNLSSSDVYTKDYFTEICVLFNVISFSNVLMTYFIVVYPLKKSQKFIVQNSDVEMSVSREVTRSHSHRIGHLKEHKLKLDDILQNKFGYRALIKHLSSEFCMENLLSMTEFLQFKAFVHRKCPHSQMNKTLRYWLTILPLKDLPHSEIVYFGENINENAMIQRKKSKNMVKQTSVSEQDEEEYENDFAGDDYANIVSRCKEKARNLWSKYIAVGSEYEVNISYQLRRKYQGLFENEEQWMQNEEYSDLVILRDIFDDCNVVARKLIKHSWQRFTDSEHFEKVKKEFGIKQNDQRYVKHSVGT